MPKQNTTIILLIVATVVFSGQAVFGQTGTATGGYEEIVKRLQDKLKTFKNDSLSKETGTVLSETGEADLGPKLVESYLGSVGKINAAINGVTNSGLTMQNIGKNMEALESVGGLLDEIDQKAFLIQIYYDALSEDARKAWSGTASERMTNRSKPTIDALKALGLVCPANQIELHNKMCFNSYEQVTDRLRRLLTLEKQLEDAAANLKRSQSSLGYDSYDSPDSYSDSYNGPPPLEYSDSEDSPQPQRPAKLTLAEQVEALVMGTASSEQVKPLTDLLASAMDGMLAEKRDELAQLRRPTIGFGRNNFFGGESGSFDEYGNSSPDYPDSSYRRNTVVTINVAQAYLNMDIRYFMARNLKQMVIDASDANRDALLKAWCAVCEPGSAWDVLPLVLVGVPRASFTKTPDQDVADSQTSASSPSPQAPRGMSALRTTSPRGMASAQRNTSLTKLEMLSAMPGYRSDLRVQYESVGCSITDSDLSIQTCFNLGKPVLPLIKLMLASQVPPSRAKVALIEATQYMGDPDAAAFLLPLLISTDRSIASAAGDAIAVVGDQRASAALVKGLNDPKLAEIIVGILKRMGSTSTQDIIPMFKSGNPVTDKFCIDILKDSGDINTLYYLAAILERYHNAPAKKDMPQAEKSELLMLTMEAGVAIISRNMQKAPPALTVPVLVTDAGKPRLDYSVGVAAAGGLSGMDSGMPMGRDAGMGRDMGMGMPPRDAMMMQDSPQAMPQRTMSPDSAGSTGSSTTATLPDVNQLAMQPGEIKNKAPFAWLDTVYKVAAKHVDDTATIMKSVKTDDSGKKIGTDIRNERVDKEFFRTVINTSEEGLGTYLADSQGDVNKLKVQKDRVIRDFGVHQKELNRIKQRKSSYDAFIEASTGKKPGASGTSTGGTGSGTTSPAATNPLGRRL